MLDLIAAIFGWHSMYVLERLRRAPRARYLESGTLAEGLRSPGCAADSIHGLAWRTLHISNDKRVEQCKYLLIKWLDKLHAKSRRRMQGEENDLDHTTTHRQKCYIDYLVRTLDTTSNSVISHPAYSGRHYRCYWRMSDCTHSHKQSASTTSTSIIHTSTHLLPLNTHVHWSWWKSLLANEDLNLKMSLPR